MKDKVIKYHKLFYSLTMMIVLITSIVMILQIVYPEVLNIFRRDPLKLTSGEWWRLITPLLVHADGWEQYIFNMACIILIGIEVERLYGKVSFLFLYLIGGLSGEIAGYVWDPYGAGASIGLCGLIGGLYMISFCGKMQPNTFSSLLSLYMIVGLIGFTIETIYVSIVLCIVVAISTRIMMTRKNRTERLSIFVGGGGLLGGLMLLVFHDIHGVAILAGACTAMILLLIDKIFVSCNGQVHDS